MGRKPRATKEEINFILDTAMSHVKSVPYGVSLRWVFYRLLQDSVYKDKKEYGNCKELLGRVRKKMRRGWKQDTLIDDTRNIIWRGVGAEDYYDWVDSLKCTLDKIQTQKHIVLIIYEARAMTQQFAYYTKHIPLIPLGGDASIPYKWEIAKEIEQLHFKYDQNPITVLYFGDADSKGKQIKDSAMKDIIDWCGVDFEVKHCGLTLKQAKKYKLPENPEKPGEYQWEALSDKQAKAIITAGLKGLQDVEKYEPVYRKEKRLLAKAKKKFKTRG